MSNGVPKFLQFTQSVAAIDIVDILGLYYTSSDFYKEVSPVQVHVPRQIAMLLSGAQSLRDVIAFPKSQKAVCLLTDAPSQVHPKQLRELGIKTVTGD